ncbi:ABC transporter permease [PVC group bacterium]|nr:ABC transporter permease [PVC group bacterium]
MKLTGNYWRITLSLKLLNIRREYGWMSVISLISVLGVAVGVAALIIVLSVMNGFEENFREKILGVNAHMMIEKDVGISQYLDISNDIASQPHIVGVSPYVRGVVMIRHQQNVSGAELKGIISAYERNVSRIHEFIQEGKFDFSGQEEQGVVLGSVLADTLRVKINDSVEIISPVLERNNFGNKIPISRTLRIVGIFHSGMYEVDAAKIFTSLSTAQVLFGVPDVVSGFSMKVDDPFQVQKIKMELKQNYSYPYWVRDWTDLNENLFSAMKLEKTVMFLVLTLIIVVAAMNIASTLFMGVIEKTREIGILKALGATSRDILFIFTIKGFLISFFGVLLGVLTGVGVSVYLEKNPLIGLPSDIYYIDALPVALNSNDIMIVVLTAIGVCLMASLVPAKKAAALNIVKALRYE